MPGLEHRAESDARDTHRSVDARRCRLSWDTEHAMTTIFLDPTFSDDVRRDRLYSDA